MTINKQIIRNYWETRLPQRWYSNKEYGTKEYWDEISDKRYNLYYPFFKKIMGFNDFRGKKLLEIGIGVGTDILEYAKGGAIVTGVDLTQSAVDTVTERFKLYRMEGVFKIGDAENLPFDDNTFDIVISWGVLHHTPNTEKCIEEVERVLKKSGESIILLYAKGWKHYAIRMFYHGIMRGELFRMSAQEVTNKYSEVEGNSPLTKVYNKKQIKKLFLGWNEVNIYRYRLGPYFEYPHYGKPMLPKPIRYMAKVLRLEKILGESWVIKAKTMS